MHSRMKHVVNMNSPCDNTLHRYIDRLADPSERRRVNMTFAVMFVFIRTDAHPLD